MSRLRPLALTLALALGCHHAPPVRARPPVARRGAEARGVDLRRDVDVGLIEQHARTQRYALGRPSRFKVAPDGAVLFLRASPDSPARDLYEWDRRTGAERVLATAQRLLGGDETLDAAERARRERQRIAGRGVTSYELSSDGARVLVPLSGRLFVITRATGAVAELPSGGGAPIDARFSPDGRYVSFVRGGELMLYNLATRASRALTEGATENVTHAVAEFIAQEELDRMEGYWWSPDSARLVYQETDLSRVERLRLSDPSHPESPPESPAYPRAGTPNAEVRLAVVSAAGSAPTWIEWDRAQYPYLATVRWTANAPLTLVVLNRAQSDALVLAVDAEGHTRALHHEHDDAWLNVDPAFPRWSPDGRTFLWSTEREGAWQVERRDAGGALVAALTPVAMNARAFVQYDDAHQALYVLAGEDPTASRLARVTDDHGTPRVEALTPENGEVDAVVSDDGATQVRTLHTLEALPRVTVCDRDGVALGEITSVTEAPLAVPRVEVRTVGAEGFRVAVVRPRDYDPSRRYPVIAWVYGGPHSRLVAHAMERFVVQQWLADQGFVVVLADGRGTQARGRAWERALRLRLGDVPLDDQVAALRALAADDRSLDVARAGVIGWSFGGYLSARAVIERPDVFRAAVAGAPVTDWREYDTCYTERYLGLPDQESDAYARSSLLPHAGALRRPLLIVHGTADDNVYFHNGLRLADALFRAGRRFDFLPLAGQTHLVNDPQLAVAWLLRARAFFLEHLRS